MAKLQLHRDVRAGNIDLIIFKLNIQCRYVHVELVLVYHGENKWLGWGLRRNLFQLKKARMHVNRKNSSWAPIFVISLYFDNITQHITNCQLLHGIDRRYFRLKAYSSSLMIWWYYASETFTTLTCLWSHDWLTIFNFYHFFWFLFFSLPKQKNYLEKSWYNNLSEDLRREFEKERESS